MEMTQEKLVHIGREYFQAHLPSLRAISKPAVDNMLVFISASVAYGCCDDLSDIDIEVFVNVPMDDNVRMNMQEVFADEHWHDTVRISCGLTMDYWRFDLLLQNDMESFWERFNPYALYNIRKAIPLWDPSGLLPLIREKVSFYPDFMLKKIVRGLWITANDSGDYNTDFAVKRKAVTEGHMFLYKAIEALLRLAYLLNGGYYPPSKWITSALDSLEDDFGLREFLIRVHESSLLKEKYELYSEVHRRIQNHLLKHDVIERESVENYGSIFARPYYIFSTF